MFFLDKCLGRIVVANALRQVGLGVELHADHFAQDAPDHFWIPEVGNQGWIILTKDRRLRTNQLEIRALLKSGTASFVLSAAEITGDKMAMAFVTAMPTMMQFLRRFQRPFVASVTPSGRVSLHANHAQLIAKID